MALSHWTLGFSWVCAAFPAAGADVEASGTVRGAALVEPEALSISQITSLAEALDRVRTDDESGALYGVLLSARASVSDRLVPALGYRVGLDTGLLNFDARSGVFGDGRPLGDHLRRTLLTGEVYLDLQPCPDGSLVLRLGKLRALVADGAVFAGQALGLSVDFDLRYRRRPLPLRFEAFFGLSDAAFDETLRTSPLLHGAATSFLGDHALTLSQSVLFDVDDALLPLLFGPSLASDLDEGRRARLIRANASRGWISWTGLQWRWQTEAFELGALGVLAAGRETLSGPVPRRDRRAEVDVALLSGFGKIEGTIKWRLGPATLLRLRPFALVASGDRDLGEPGARSWGAFPSLAPLVPLTRYFLGAATLPAQQQPTLQSLAPDGAGLLGAGLGWEGLFGPWRVELTGAHFRSFEPPSQGTRPRLLEARTYGTEVDLQIDWFFADWGFLGAEAAVFSTGDFYGSAPAAWQSFAGVGVFWDSRPRLP